MTIVKLMRNYRFRTNLVATPVETRLSLHTGEFIAVPSGVTARLQPPFSKLSGHYPWEMFPASLVALKVLAMGNRDGALGGECETIGLVEKMFGLTETAMKSARDEDRRALEDTDTWCTDVERIVHWGVGLTPVCPVASVARDLSCLPAMSPADLDRYARNWLS